MGNNRSSSATVFHGNSSTNRGKFWKKRASKSEHLNGAEKSFTNNSHQHHEDEAAQHRKTAADGGRRTSLYQQSASNKSAGISGFLRKSKSEKAHEVFATSADLPFPPQLDNDSIDSSAMSSGNTNQNNPQENHFKKFAAPRADHIHFCSSASTSSRLQHRLAIAAENGNNKRRVKSFRHFPSSRTRGALGNLNNRPTPTCTITGLSQVQKRLILSRWRQFWDRLDLLSICTVVFERIFENRPHLALLVLHQPGIPFIGKTSMPLEISDLGLSRPFKHHVERFCQTLHDVLISLEENNVSFAEQILLDFGAIHAQVSTVDKIPLEYWETLLHCLSDAGQIQTDKQIPILENLQRNPLVDTLDRRIVIGGSFFCSRRSVEAWQLFCIFLVSKIKFGYEMECFLRDYFCRVSEILEDMEVEGEETTG